MNLLGIIGSKLAAIAVAILIAAPSPGIVVPLGVITHAEHANLGTAAASVGSTIYDGDSVSTESGGTILVTAGTITLELAPQSFLTVRQVDCGVMAQLGAGRLAFSARRNSVVAIMADGATIRPMGNGLVVTYVQIIGKKELLISARHGVVELFYHGESGRIAEGQTVRVQLDPSEREIAAASASDGSKSAAKTHHTFLLVVVVGLTLAITIPLAIHALESPDRPGAAGSKAP